MSQSSIQTLLPSPSPIESAPVHSERMTHRSLRPLWTIAILAFGLFCLAAQAVAGPLDSIPVGSSDRILLQQNATLTANGAASNLFLPANATVFFDVAVPSGREVLLMVITEEQWQAMSAGEKPSGSPLLRTTVRGVGTESVQLQRGTYVVAMIPRGSQGSFQVTLRARGRAL